jgi:CubicO group peptidase (beta-lactamase class C family)
MAFKSTSILCILGLMAGRFPLPAHSQMPVVSAPDKAWEYVRPEAVGMRGDLLLEALGFLESGCLHDGIRQVVVVRHGRVVFQGDSAFKKHNIYSCSKTFTSTVLGLLIGEGRVALDHPVATVLPELKTWYPEVTFRHFATMTSGYSAAGISRWNGENADWSSTPYSPEPPHFAPGTYFEYWDEAQMMFGRALTALLGCPMADYFDERIARPIGMGEWSWATEGELDGVAVNNGCTGIHISALQLARFGQLYLNEGAWNGAQLIPAAWCRAATRPQVRSDIPVYAGDRNNVQGSGSYGFNWWVNSPDGLSRMPDAPPATAYMSGLHHNVCFILPEWDMVIVRMGEDGNPPEGKHVLWNEVLKRMAGAIVEP